MNLYTYLFLLAYLNQADTHHYKKGLARWREKIEAISKMVLHLHFNSATITSVP